MSKNIKYCLTVFKNGLFDQNPTFVQVLGMCPTLATTTSVPNAFGMGLAATFVLTCSNALISLLRRLIPKQVRIAAYIVVIAGFVSIIEMLIKAYLPELNKSLGVFIPLIVVNCIILARAEAFASKNKVLPSVFDGLGMGLGFTCALIIIASVREIFGNGTFCDIPLFGDGFKPIRMLIMPYGAFITLGILIAAANKIRSIIPANSRKPVAAEGDDTVTDDPNKPAEKADDSESEKNEPDDRQDSEKKDTGSENKEQAGSEHNKESGDKPESDNKSESDSGNAEENENPSGGSDADTDNKNRKKNRKRNKKGKKPDEIAENDKDNPDMNEKAPEGGNNDAGSGDTGSASDKKPDDVQDIEKAEEKNDSADNGAENNTDDKDNETTSDGDGEK